VGVLFGIAAAVCWGLGDYFITLLTRRVGTTAALLSVQVLSLAAWLVFLIATPTRAAATPALWWLLAATAVCHVLGLVFVYRAFEVGTLSIVSPISAGFAVVTALLALGTGERPPAIALIGACLLVGGVILATRPASTPGGPRPSIAGVPEAILSALAFGTMFWLFYFHVQPKLGYAWPLVFLKAMAVGSTLLVFLRRRPAEAAPLRPSLGRLAILALAAAGADTVAWLAYIGGTSAAYATVVTALASLFSVVTVLLAWIFLRERLAAHQWTGVAIILGGILLVSF
jgi:drug/metabolite transporter (DMT)-like permease